MRKPPDLDQITAFAAVAEELSFKRAAQRLAIDASALSRRIKELETRLVFPLLFRTTQVVELTAAGKRFYDGNQQLVLVVSKRDLIMQDRWLVGLRCDLTVARHCNGSVKREKLLTAFYPQESPKQPPKTPEPRR